MHKKQLITYYNLVDYLDSNFNIEDYNRCPDTFEYFENLILQALKNNPK